MDLLRKKIEEITKEKLECQAQLIKKLKEECEHTINLIKEFSYDREEQYNCFAYALGIPYEENIRNILRNNWNIKLGTEFVQNLIDTGILESNEDGKIIVYFRDSNPVHAGIVLENKKIISKWGTGHLWEHDLLELPKCYGSDYKIFDGVDPKIIIDEFVKYSKNFI